MSNSSDSDQTVQAVRLLIFSIFSHALIKLGIGISNNPDKTDV
ncbi:TPA: hypothetical protein OSY19_004433 [Escherichia coli]|nr:hypothetical protein [Escherichia coli]